MEGPVAGDWSTMQGTGRCLITVATHHDVNGSRVATTALGAMMTKGWGGRGG